MKIAYPILLLLLPLWSIGCRSAEEATVAPKPLVSHTFTDSLIIPTPEVRRQLGGTCWAYGVVGMWESEALREGVELDLSELWLVRAAYYEKAVKFVRTRGRVGFSQGGELGDAVALARKYGVADQGWIDSARRVEIDHGRLLRRIRWWALKCWILDRYEQPGWDCELQAILDREIAPTAGVAVRHFDDANYRGYGSYLHHPYHTEFTLEVPDNWMGHKSYNLQLEELMAKIDESLLRGYTVGWNADTSEVGFRPRAGVAELAPDCEVSPEARQEAFDRGLTTDDHIMQLVGIAYRDDGKRYYKVRNSWGKGGHYKGYLYASEEYVKMKTIEILVREF